MTLRAEITTVPRADLFVKVRFFYGERVVHTSGGSASTAEEASALVEQLRDALTFLGVDFTEPQATGG